MVDGAKTWNRQTNKPMNQETLCLWCTASMDWQQLSCFSGVKLIWNVPWSGNRSVEPRALEVEFFLMEEVLHEKVKIHR